MSTGSNLLESIKGVRKFFGDLGQLLTASDGIMAERGWEPIGDSTCLFWTSMSISKGTHWVPRIAMRNYLCPEHAPKTLAMISLLIDDFEMDFSLTEPAVCASYFVMLDDIPPSECWVERWHACWLGYRDVPLDGTPYTIDTSDEHWKPSHRFKHMQVFGRPLVEITNQDLLNQKIITPLLSLIAANTETPSEAATGKPTQ